MMKNFLLTLLLLFSLSGVHGQLPVTDLTADCEKITGTYNSKKLLNVARGGHGINRDLNWMPSFYDDLVEIGIDEFRIDWLLSDWLYEVVSRDANNELVYDFSRLDTIILPLARKGIKPVMCMAYMASAIGDMEGPPNDYSEYQSAIKTYVRHYKDLGYTGWAWESHNEPEGFTELTPGQTYKMYDHFAAAVKEIDSTARVGGFGSVGHDWMNYLRSFLNLYKSDTSKPAMDFFSFHQYGKQSWPYVPEVEHEFEVRDLPIPDLYITEWNNSWGPAIGEGNGGVVGGGYDTNVNAAYVAKKFYHALDYENLKKIYYWNFADPDPNKTFSGSSGLFTVDNHRKAAGNTFRFFNNLYSNIVSTDISGPNSASRDVYGIVTRDQEHKKLSAILWNYTNEPVVVNSLLENLPALEEGKEYKIRKLAIDHMHGNYYYDYINSVENAPHEKAQVIDTARASAQNTYSRTDTLPAFSVIQLLMEPVAALPSSNRLDPNSLKSKGINLKAYPTPFNDYLTVQYILTKPCPFQLKLYNGEGKLVKLLDTGTKQKGHYQANFSTGSLTPGIFFLNLETPGEKDGVKLIKK